jgi:hypothetical protein
MLDKFVLIEKCIWLLFLNTSRNEILYTLLAPDVSGNCYPAGGILRSSVRTYASFSNNVDIIDPIDRFL